jgi:hypothetical protein
MRNAVAGTHKKASARIRNIKIHDLIPNCYSQQRTRPTVMLRQPTAGNGLGIAMKTNLLLLAILYLLGTSSFAAANPFDDAVAAYDRGD